MNLNYISVYKIHDFVMDRPLSIEKIQDRVIAQKVVYLSNQFGVSCGDFEFSWYKKGPYSRALTKLLYDNINQDEDQHLNNYMLNYDAKKNLEPLKRLVQSRPKDLSEADWLELLASIHFLYKQYYPLLKDEVVNNLLFFKPKYTPSQAKIAIGKLEKSGIIT